MAKKLFVGNLGWDVTDLELQELFEQFGEIEKAFIIKEKGVENPRSRGFGFIIFVNDADADAAIEALDGTEFQSPSGNGIPRELKVNEAKPLPPRDERYERDDASF
jgi:RNA recognition motif-containing protein